MLSGKQTDKTYVFFEKSLATPQDFMRQYLQVAQLWQRDRAKFETFSINVHRYSQNHTQNCVFGPPYLRIGGNVSGLFDSFNAKKLCNRVSFQCYS